MRESIHRAIELELKAQRLAQRSLWINIERIELLDLGPGRFVYRLELVEEVRATADSPIKIKVPSYERVFTAQVLTAVENVLIISVDEPLPEQMGLVRIQFDPAFILRKLDEHLDQVLRFPTKPLKAVLEKTIPPPDKASDDANDRRLTALSYRLNDSQRKAILRIESDLVHLVWGPPGTGKTYTLGVGIAEHIKCGKSCLLLSNSNSAVDEMVKAVAGVLGEDTFKVMFRYGASPDERVNAYTAFGHLEKQNPEVAAEARAAHRLLQGTTLSGGQRKGEVFLTEIDECRRKIREFEQESRAASEALIRQSPCVASTLASLVINSSLSEREFDVVYIDEASMVSIAFAIAGAAQANEQVVFAGDFRQLPPICHSEDKVAQTWFAENIFDHLDIPDAVRGSRPIPSFVSMLNEQYRMTQAIGSIVSDLSYGGKLISAQGKSVGQRPLFIDVSNDFGQSHFSVHDKSYYQPYSAVLLQNLHTHFRDWLGPKIEFLSPFRAQRTLLQAVAKDLSSSAKSFGAKTIHKAQGSQENTIVVDLTAHSADKPQRFFIEEDAENLINVALSRAQQRLIIIGSLKMISNLGRAGNYWDRFLQIVLERCDKVDASKFMIGSTATEDVGAFASTKEFDGKVDLPCVFVDGSDLLCPQSVHDLFSKTRSMTRLIVVKDIDSPRTGHGVTYRHDRGGNIPAFMTWGGWLFLPLGRDNTGQHWVAANLAETTKRLSTIACGHLFDSSFEVKDTLRLLCLKCTKGLILKGGRGSYRLACDGEYCFYSRPMSKNDARILIEVCSMSCPKCGAKPLPRESGQGVFIGCSNYPPCEGKVSLAAYADRAWSF